MASESETSTPSSAPAIALRLPFTVAAFAVVLGVGAFTQTAWLALSDQPLFANVGFGVPALAEGRWWTVLTGSVFAVNSLAFALLLIFIVVGVGACEWLFGSRRAILVTVGLQLAGVLGGIGIAALLGLTGWGWGQQLADELDAGLSAGALGAAVVASAAIRPPWRGRLRFAVFALVLTSLVFLGYLADVIHLVAILIAWPLGTLLAGRNPRIGLPNNSRDEVRKLSASFFILAGVLAIIGTFVGRNGPLGVFGGEHADPYIWIGAALDLAIGIGLLRGRRTWWRVALAITGFSLALLLLAIWLIPDEVFDASSGLLILNVVLLIIQVGVLIFGRSAFRNPGRRGLRRLTGARIGGTPTEAERAHAMATLTSLGSANRLAWIGTWSENSWWFPTKGEGVVSYQVQTGVAIGLCDPVCPPGQLAAVAEEFVTAVGDAGLTPCFFSGTAAVRDWALGRGWLALPVAQEAVIDLPALAFTGKKWQDIRTAQNQAAKASIEHRLVRLASQPRAVRVQVRSISAEWVGEKELPEMGFTLGGVEEALDEQTWVSLAIDTDGTVHGFTSWLPVHSPGGSITGWTLDVMRRAPESFRYTMEFLIASACLAFQADGYQFVSLSGAPLAQAEDAESGVLDLVVKRLGEAVEPYYGFASLERFKGKFLPRHEPLYLVAADEAAMARAGVAVAKAYLAHATPGQLFALARPPE